MLLAAASFTLFHTAMLSGSVVLPLYLTRTLERPDGDVGLLFSMPLLIGTQVARGVALSVVGALGITYVQDLLPRATGRATALFANILTTGSLISGILAGATAQALGYRAALLLCGILSAAGCVLLASQRRSAADTGLEPWASPALARQEEANAGR